MRTPPTAAERARNYLLDIEPRAAITTDLPLVLATAAQAEAMLAVAESIDAVVETVNALLVPKSGAL